MAVSVCNVHINPQQREVTAHGNVEFPVACYEDDMEVESVPVHWHDEFEYIQAVRGTVYLCVGTERLVLRENTAVFINSGCLHSVFATKNEVSVLRSLVIHPRLVGGSSESFFWKTLVDPFVQRSQLAYVPVDGSEPWHGVVMDSMLMAWEQICQEAYDYENEARFLISRAVRRLADHLPENEAGTGQQSAAVQRVKLVLRYIEEHYAEDLSNKLLTEQAFCSESVLLRSFKQVTAVSPMQYVMNYRMEKAAALLASTDWKSGEIATRCGFNDISYFTKMFRKRMGKTPVEYRKSVRN